MNNRLDIAAIVISTIALLISGASLYLNWNDHEAKYKHSVVVESRSLENRKMPRGMRPLDVTVTNTSHSNLRYTLSAETNMGCLRGANSKPELVPCSYESQQISLSNMTAGQSEHTHHLQFDAYPGAVKTNLLASISPAKYYFRISVEDDSNHRVLYQSICYYYYSGDAKAFLLDQPMLDTSGQSKTRQLRCRL